MLVNKQMIAITFEEFRTSSPSFSHLMSGKDFEVLYFATHVTRTVVPTLTEESSVNANISRTVVPIDTHES